MAAVFAGARLTHDLSLLLCLLLAWPGCVPMSAKEAPRASVSEFAPASRDGTPAFTATRRPSVLDEGVWTDVAASCEVSDDRDDFCQPILAFPLESYNLPSLIPTTDDLPAAGVLDPLASWVLAPPLRC